MEPESMNDALRAYERGRWAFALQHATGAVVFAGSAIVIHDASLSVLAISLVVVFGQLLAAYAHHDWLRGAWLGLALGAVQLLAAVFMAQIGMRLFPERCMDMCFAIVLLGSVGVGFAFAKLFASRPFGSLRRGGLAFVAMGATMVALCCMAGSLALLTGSAFGVALGAAPGWVLLREA